MENFLKVLTLFFQNLTRMVSLLLVLMMGAVWAYLSIKAGMLQPVSENFIWVGCILMVGEVGAGLDVVGKLNRRFDSDSKAA